MNSSKDSIEKTAAKIFAGAALAAASIERIFNRELNGNLYEKHPLIIIDNRYTEDQLKHTVQFAQSRTREI